MTEEVWKNIDGYNGVYKVSNLGRVKSIDRVNGKGARIKGKILKTRKNNSGYLTLHLYNGSRESRELHYVHRLVAQAFLDNTNETVNHKDGVKTNNNINNLEWVKHSENIIHGYKTGLMKRCKKATVTTPTGKELVFHNLKACSTYFGFKSGWVQHRVKIHGKKFTYDNYSIEVK